jgi:DNA-binding protein H-NS
MARTPAKRAKKSAPVKRAARAERARSEIEKLLKSLEDMSVAALRKVVECATALIAQKTEGEKRSFIEEMTARAKSLGVSITDLFGKSAPKPPKKAAPKKRAGVRARPPIIFKGPNPDDTWTGRGRRPRWLVALEDEGKDRKDYAV